MKRVNIKIDNRRIDAFEGQTIFQAARENGIEIPHMCYDPRLDPFTSCWLCVVEVKGFPRLVPSCTAKVAEGMEVITESERIDSARKTCLKLLLSDHYGDCIAPCQRACPDHIDIQGYLGLIALGRYRDALELIREVNPLPLSVGRVCPRFCERECRRNLVDEPVCINYLKRFLSENAYESIDLSGSVSREKSFKVAIIGAGPAGLTAAHFLRLKGYAVTIIEANGRPGGMMRYGIPEYRLPKKEMDKEIGLILNMGVKIEFGKKFGRDIGLKGLLSQGYSAVVLAIGAWAERLLGCDGEELQGVESGIGLLYRIAAGERIVVGERVSVIGGGNTAIDVARSCLRMGAKEVNLVYRRSRQEMPALDEEVNEAELEGVTMHFLSAPVKLIGEGGKVKAMYCVRMSLGEPDASGRRKPIPIKGSEYEFQTDMVVAAIGQFTADQQILKEEGIELAKGGTINVNQETMQTNIKGIFAAGDCVTGPATIIESIAGGRQAAAGIDLYLRLRAEGDMAVGTEKVVIDETAQMAIPTVESKFYNHSKGDLSTIDKTPFEGYERIERAKMPSLPKHERLNGFPEVELGLSEDTVKGEAMRCLSCGCEAVFDCKLREYATHYGITWEEISKGRYNQYKQRDEHTFIFRDRNKCIRCGLCVRICAEVEGVSALGFINRGFISIIDPPLDYILKESTCDSCGLCLSACPTGALEYRPRLPRIGPWSPKITETICTLCGIGCQISVRERAGYCIEVLPRLDGSHNQGKLCWKGTFGWEMLNSTRRIERPFLRQGGGMIEISFNEAFTRAALALKNIIEMRGPQSIAVVASPRLSNEERFLIHKFMEATGIKDLYSPGYREGVLTLMAQADNTNFSSISGSDLIITLGSRIVEDYPVISYMIKDGVKGGGALGIIGNEADRLTLISRVYIDSPPGDIDKILSLLIAVAVEEGVLTLPVKGDSEAITPLNPVDRERLLKYVKRGEIRDIINLLMDARKPTIIYNAEIVSANTIAWLFEGIWEKGDSKEKRVALIPLQRFGLPALPLSKEVYLPIGDLKENIKKAKTSAVIAFGHWKGLERIKETYQELLLIQCAVFETRKGYTPDYLFPASLPLESMGSFVNVEGRHLGITGAFIPPSGLRNWEIIQGLARAVGLPLIFRSFKEVSNAMPATFKLKDRKDFINFGNIVTDDKIQDMDWFEDEVDIYLKKEIKEEMS